MTCDKCNKPAVVHEVTIRNGKKAEIHLCSEHAAEAGFVAPQPETTINQLLKQFVVSQGPAATAQAAKKSCPGCGLTYAQFRKTGTLGCAECYESFEAELSPLIERAHNGGTHHIGKRPERVGRGGADRQLEVRRLIKELDRAVAAEQYERAAEIRDRLNMLEPEFHDETHRRRASQRAIDQ
jgi:protein arginine kinase activator